MTLSKYYNLWSSPHLTPYKFVNDIFQKFFDFYFSFFTLKSKRVKQSAKDNTKGFITERFRDHIKGQLRKNLKYECVKSGKHSDWLDNTNTSVHS